MHLSHARRRIRAVVTCAVVVASGALSLAANAQPREETRAQTLFREGREAMERNDLGVACDKFDESHRLEGAVGPLLNLANCEEKRGRLGKALTAYRDALAISRPDQVDQRKLAEERSADLAQRVPTLTLRRAGGAPADTTATLDGVAIELGDRPVPVDPGPHRIDVSAPGRRTDTRKLQVVLRDRIELNLEPGPADVAPSAAKPREAVPTSEGDPLLVGGLVAGGVGVAGLVVFAVTGAVALDASSTLEDACGPEHRCAADDAVGRDAADTGDAMLAPNAIGLGVGLVGVGVGITLLVLSGGSDRASSLLDVGPRGAGWRARF